MKSPLVTIVTPSFNQGRFIRATIESVLGQDYPNIEYIIMDGGSADETASIAREYGGRLTFISERDNGQAHAINKGFRIARGEVIAWLNSDDIILPGAVSAAVRAFERTPSLGAVYGEGYRIAENGELISRFESTQQFDLWILTYASDYILQQTTYFNRKILDDVGYLNENLHWGLDWDYFMRIGKRYWMECIPQYMGSIREYDEAKTLSGGRRRFRELVGILREHGKLRYPPGYFVYGLDTYNRIICRYLPLDFMRRASTNLLSFAISRILNGCRGIYVDGWAGKRVSFMFPTGGGRMRLSGLVPEAEELAGQHVRITCDGEIVARRDVPFGRFDIEFDYRGRDPGSAAHVEIEASRSIVPRRYGLAGDRRKLAYLFGEMKRIA